MSGVATAIGVTGLVSAGVSAYGASQSGKGGSNAQMWVPPKDENTEALNKLKLDYAQQAYSNYGNPTESFMKLRPQLVDQYENDMQNRMYGGGGMGGPGVMQGITDMGAATGIGDKATMAGMKKAYWDYLQNSKAFDTEMAQIGFQSSENEMNRASGSTMQNPYAPAGIIPGTNAQQPYDWSGTASGIGDAIGQMNWGGSQGAGDTWAASQPSNPYAGASTLSAPNQIDYSGMTSANIGGYNG